MFIHVKFFKEFNIDIMLKNILIYINEYKFISKNTYIYINNKKNIYKSKWGVLVLIPKP